MYYLRKPIQNARECERLDQTLCVGESLMESVISSEEDFCTEKTFDRFWEG